MEQRQRVQAIIIQNNKVLFGAGRVGQEYRHFFIGGGIEKGETPEEAIVREIKEETNTVGTIIFKFENEYKENHHTFLATIGEQKVVLGYDPEEEEVNINSRALQNLEFIGLEEYSRFTSIDISYFKLLMEECNNRNYVMQEHDKIKSLVEGAVHGK